MLSLVRCSEAIPLEILVCGAKHLGNQQIACCIIIHDPIQDTFSRCEGVGRGFSGRLGKCYERGADQLFIRVVNDKHRQPSAGSIFMCLMCSYLCLHRASH